MTSEYRGNSIDTRMYLVTYEYFNISRTEKCQLLNYFTAIDLSLSPITPFISNSDSLLIVSRCQTLLVGIPNYSIQHQVFTHLGSKCVNHSALRRGCLLLDALLFWVRVSHPSCGGITSCSNSVISALYSIMCSSGCDFSLTSAWGFAIFVVYRVSTFISCSF